MKQTKAKPKAASKAKPKTAYAQGALSTDDKLWLRAELASWHVKLVEKIEELLNASKEEVAEAAAEAAGSATKLPPVPFVT